MERSDPFTYRKVGRASFSNKDEDEEPEDTEETIKRVIKVAYKPKNVTEKKEIPKRTIKTKPYPRRTNADLEVRSKLRSTIKDAEIEEQDLEEAVVKANKEGKELKKTIKEAKMIKEEKELKKTIKEAKMVKEEKELRDPNLIKEAKEGQTPIVASGLSVTERYLAGDWWEIARSYVTSSPVMNSNIKFSTEPSAIKWIFSRKNVGYYPIIIEVYQTNLITFSDNSSILPAPIRSINGIATLRGNYMAISIEDEDDVKELGNYFIIYVGADILILGYKNLAVEELIILSRKFDISRKDIDRILIIVEKNGYDGSSLVVSNQYVKRTQELVTVYSDVPIAQTVNEPRVPVFETRVPVFETRAPVTETRVPVAETKQKKKSPFAKTPTTEETLRVLAPIAGARISNISPQLSSTFARSAPELSNVAGLVSPTTADIINRTALGAASNPPVRAAPAPSPYASPQQYLAPAPTPFGTPQQYLAPAPAPTPFGTPQYIDRSPARQYTVPAPTPFGTPQQYAVPAVTPYQ